MSAQVMPKQGLIDRVFHCIEQINHWTGRVVSYLAVVMMLTVMYEVIARYFFASPTLWSTELNIYLLCAYVLLAGGYNLQEASHVRVDIFWSTLSDRGKAIADIITAVLFFAFCTTMVWKGTEMAVRSLLDNKTSAEAMAWPLFPSQLTIPIGGLLMLLQGLVKLRNDISTLRRGVH